MEEALMDLVIQGRIDVPRFEVNFSGDLADIGTISTLAAPHRVFDAIMRDSELNGQPFFKSDIYKNLTKCNVRNATELFARSPTALLFGCWDSTGAAGGQGNKFARAITSEIVGINAEWGVTEGGIRQDPLRTSAEVEIRIDESGDWDVVGKSATGKKDRAKGTRPAEINHGNILVSVEKGTRETIRDDGTIQSQKLPLRGGVTVDYAVQTTVLSLTALRRLCFPVNDKSAEQADLSARCTLAALGLVAITANRERGYWLRSRCGLIADGTQDFEIVYPDGRTVSLPLTADEAIDAYKAATEAALSAGLPWYREPVHLTPQRKLVELVMKSREIQSLGA